MIPETKPSPADITLISSSYPGLKSTELAENVTLFVLWFSISL